MRPAPGPRGEVALLLLAGFGFGGGQQMLLREFVSLLYGEEVVLLLVTGAALLAASLGYRLGERLGGRALVGLLLGCAALQLLSPGLPRLVVAGLCWLRGGTGPELVAVLAGFAFVAAAPFAALLPALLRERGSAGERLAALRRGYTAELLGFAVGAATATMLGGLPDLRLGLHALDFSGQDFDQVALVHRAPPRRAAQSAADWRWKRRTAEAWSQVRRLLACCGVTLPAAQRRFTVRTFSTNVRSFSATYC